VNGDQSSEAFLFLRNATNLGLQTHIATAELTRFWNWNLRFESGRTLRGLQRMK